MPRVLHFEIHADDPERAMNFYKTLFDWSFQEFEGPMPYWLVTTGPDSEPGINGGLHPRQGAIDGTAVIAYVCTVGVNSLEESIATATSHGGSIAVPTMAIPGMGWLAYCKDTEGNIFGMLQPDETAK